MTPSLIPLFLSNSFSYPISDPPHNHPEIVLSLGLLNCYQKTERIKMHVKEWCTKPCLLGTFGLILAGFGTLFIFFWGDIFEQQLANVSKSVI